MWRKNQKKKYYKKLFFSLIQSDIPLLNAINIFGFIFRNDMVERNTISVLVLE